MDEVAALEDQRLDLVELAEGDEFTEVLASDSKIIWRRLLLISWRRVNDADIFHAGIFYAKRFDEVGPSSHGVDVDVELVCLLRILLLLLLLLLLMFNSSSTKLVCCCDLFKK